MFLLIIKIDGNIMCGQVYTHFHSSPTNLSTESLEKILAQSSCFGEVILIFLGTPTEVFHIIPSGKSLVILKIILITVVFYPALYLSRLAFFIIS